jgi:hypothetical protein
METYLFLVVVDKIVVRFVVSHGGYCCWGEEKRGGAERKTERFVWTM